MAYAEMFGGGFSMETNNLEAKIGFNDNFKTNIVSKLKLKAIEEERYFVFDESYDTSKEIVNSKENREWHFSHTVEKILDMPFEKFLVAHDIKIVCAANYTKHTDYIFNVNNAIIEVLWKALEDVTLDDKECNLSKYYIWDAGTSIDEIRRWFDLHHTGGINYLANEFE